MISIPGDLVVYPDGGGLCRLCILSIILTVAGSRASHSHRAVVSQRAVSQRTISGWMAQANKLPTQVGVAQISNIMAQAIRVEPEMKANGIQIGNVGRDKAIHPETGNGWMSPPTEKDPHQGANQ